MPAPKSSPKKSFNHQVKSTLVQKELSKPCCRRSELAAFIHYRGSVIISHQLTALSITVEGAPVARYIFRLLKKKAGVVPQVLYRKEPRLGQSYFLIKISNPLYLQKLLGALNIKNASTWSSALSLPVPSSQATCCCRSYLRGAFLVSGTMSAPSSSYHLEIFSEYEEYAHSISALMEKFGLNAGMRQRKNGYYIYLKKAESIMEFLRIIGAHPTLLQMENQRVLKSMRNHVNRMVNCETANLDKSLQAALHQLEIIQKIDRLLGLERLPTSLKEAADLRQKNPEASLKELGEMLTPPVGKSGMNHRFRKLQQLCNQLEKHN